jgi:hypothetical protein
LRSIFDDDIPSFYLDIDSYQGNGRAYKCRDLDVITSVYYNLRDFITRVLTSISHITIYRVSFKNLTEDTFSVTILTHLSGLFGETGFYLEMKSVFI